MFHVKLAPLGGTFGHLKSDLGVFWPFPATDFIMGILKIWDNFLGPQLPILKFTFLESLRNLWLFGINKKDGCFFRFRTPSGPMWGPFYPKLALTNIFPTSSTLLRTTPQRWRTSWTTASLPTASGRTRNIRATDSFHQSPPSLMSKKAKSSPSTMGWIWR